MLISLGKEPLLQSSAWTDETQIRQAESCQKIRLESGQKNDPNMGNFFIASSTAEVGPGANHTSNGSPETLSFVDKIWWNEYQELLPLR